MNAVSAALDGAAASGLMPRGCAILLAVSGGADSMALLYGASEAATANGWRLSVGHVHHGWRGREAERDLTFVQEHARRLGLPFFHRRRDARAASRELGLSPEAGARHVRYEALLEIAAASGAVRIATAHQQDDVVESHLLARQRRGGLARLAGPREEREDGVVRPLLSVQRAEILHFLAERGIAHRRDASNGNLRLSRNRVRRELADLGAAARGRLVADVARLREERRSLDRTLEERIRPGLRFLPEASHADAEILSQAPPELLRLALDRLAAPFARPGRPPMTGREREQVLRLVSSGRDFRFEAGRRIRFERRGASLRVRFAPAARPAVYDSQIDGGERTAGAGIAS